VLRSTLIINIFYPNRGSFIEEVTSGTEKIIKEIKKVGLLEPEFKEKISRYVCKGKDNE